MSELTDRLRRTPGVFITRKQLEAMLDVIDAAEALVDAPRGSPNGEGLGRAKVRERLTRFREVVE